MWNTFVDACLVITNGSSGLPQLDAALESTIAVIMFFDSGGVPVIFATVSESSTHAVSLVSWV